MDHRYMIVKYVQKPNGNWDEHTEFRKNIKTSHIQSAKVILDFKEKACIVNSLNREATFDDMLELYKRLMGDKLTPHLPEGY